MEIIQQWQYNGPVADKLLKDDAFLLAKDLGVTALQSYVAWSDIEPREGSPDFSLYDPLVEKLHKHGLGWAPFLILGPSYSIPKWKREKCEIKYFRCIEHGHESGIASIWDPALRPCVEHFIKLFHTKYGDNDAVKSILLGISGNWGEAIYPVNGGFEPDNHMHMGWWAGDSAAVGDFREKMRGKYGCISELNKAWGASLESFDQVSCSKAECSSRLKHALHRLWYGVSYMLPPPIKNAIKNTAVRFIRTDSDIDIKGPLRRHLDFVLWYRESMTRWSGFWLATVRKHFKDLNLFIVTGGDGHPMQGADFMAQAKTAAEYGAGIRITNLSDSYPESFSLSRPVSSACRFYGAYFETEEANLHNQEGVPMRVFDAITSGARGIYFKTLIGYGNDMCTKHHYEAGSRTPLADAFKKHAQFLLDAGGAGECIAVFYPATSVNLDPNALGLLNASASAFRHSVPFDFINETMIADGALDGYSALLVIEPCYMPETSLDVIVRWVENRGGIFIRTVNSRAEESTVQAGNGFVHHLPKHAGHIKRLTKTIYDKYPAFQQFGICGRKGGSPRGVFFSRCGENMFFYNSLANSVKWEHNAGRFAMDAHSLFKIKEKVKQKWLS